MLNMPFVSPRTTSSSVMKHQSSMPDALAHKLVNVAGICAGDRVFCCDTPDRSMASMVADLGARWVTDKKPSWPRMARNRADVALGRIPDGEIQQTMAWLETIRRRLRRGGRLVVWTAVDQHGLLSENKEQFLNLTDSAGFTSMIVGRFSDETGKEMVVATGILNR